MIYGIKGGIMYWQPMTDEDWEWVNYGTLPKNS